MVRVTRRETAMTREMETAEERRERGRTTVSLRRERALAEIARGRAIEPLRVLFSVLEFIPVLSVDS